MFGESVSSTKRMTVMAAVAALASLVGTVAAPGTSLAPVASAAPPACPWLGAEDVPAEVRAGQVVERMTLHEKAGMVALNRAPEGGYQNVIPAIPRLCLPSFRLQDGPAGVGFHFTGVTQLPAPIALAATWDTTMASSYGGIVAAEAKKKGINVVQAPNVNLARVPHNGRNFEAFGEDPYLVSRMAVAEIRAIQARGLVGNVKHFVANNQETNRIFVDEQIGERPLRELYFLAFEAAVREARVGSVMCSYNKVNAVHACHWPGLLTALLRQEWGFTGFVRSDLGAVHDFSAALNAGTDVIKPATAEEIVDVVESGAASEAALDTAVLRVLRVMFAYGLVDNPVPETPHATATSAENRASAARIAKAGTVLLKNEPLPKERVLPFRSLPPASIAVIGKGASSAPQVTGGGSARVDATNIVTPLAAVRARARAGTPVRYASGAPYVWRPEIIALTRFTVPDGKRTGLRVEYYNGTAFAEPVTSGWTTRVAADLGPPDAPTVPLPGLTPGNFSISWTGRLSANRTGRYRIALVSDEGGSVVLGGRTVISGETPSLPPVDVRLVAGEQHALQVRYADRIPGGRVALVWQPAPEPRASIAAAARLAARSDVAVVFANDDEREGLDRRNLRLPGSQDRLIAAVAKKNPRTIVVLNTGGPVLMPWLSRVAAVVQAWYPGEMDGTALAAILWGDFNPSGRLPQTFPAAETQVPASTPEQWPGVNGVAVYSEGLQVGYRWYDAQHAKPLFPFGHGLSYTSFALRNAAVTPRVGGGATVTVDLTNTGRRLGGDVVQIYVGYPDSAGEPPRALRAFTKAVLRPRETRRLTLELPPAAFRYWDEAGRRWAYAAGSYRVYVGRSSRNLAFSFPVPSVWVTG